MNNKNSLSPSDREESGTASPVLDRQRELVKITLEQKRIHELYESNFEDLVERLTRAGH